MSKLDKLLILAIIGIGLHTAWLNYCLSKNLEFLFAQSERFSHRLSSLEMQHWAEKWSPTPSASTKKDKTEEK